MSAEHNLPPEIKAALKDAERLEWLSLFWLALIVAVMTWAMGGSQAFKTAWIEDMLSLLPPAFFLISRRVEQMKPRKGFPYGFHRAGSLAFFFSAIALATIGLFLLYEGAMALAKAEHPTIGSKIFFGRDVWMGWIMIAALVFSVTPPVVLGRMKLKVARKLHDKILYVDAETNAADWRTGLASIAGILGIAFGLWWADAAMAVLISLSIVKDGFDGIRSAVISLLDGMPRALDSHGISREAQELLDALKAHYPDCDAQIRETGRFLRARVTPNEQRLLPAETRRALMNEDPWRLVELSQAARGPSAPSTQTSGSAAGFGSRK